MIDYPGAEVPPTYYGDTKVVLPAGDQKVTVTIGEGAITETIPLAAGQTVEKDIIVGVGHVVANALYAAGGDKVDACGLTFQVVKAKKKIDGSREDVLTTYGPDAKFDLPPGDYVADRDAWTRPTVEAAVQHQGRRVQGTERVASTPACWQSPRRAPRRSRILRAEEGHPGQSQGARGYGYEQNFQTTLPAGDYADRRGEARTTAAPRKAPRRSRPASGPSYVRRSHR